MRTTVDIDDDLLRVTKTAAAQSGTTVSELVDRALRSYVNAQNGTRQPFVLIEAGEEGGRCPSPDELYSLLQSEDLSRLK